MAGRGMGVTCSTVVAALPVAGLGRGASGRDRRVLGVRGGRIGRLPRLVTVAGALLLVRPAPARPGPRRGAAALERDASAEAMTRAPPRL
jgi:hypothetical protein